MDVLKMYFKDAVGMRNGAFSVRGFVSNDSLFEKGLLDTVRLFV